MNEPVSQKITLNKNELKKWKYFDKYEVIQKCKEAVFFIIFLFLF